MMQFGPKAKMIFFGIGCVIIVFGWISLFFNVKNGTNDIPLENDIQQALDGNEDKSEGEDKSEIQQGNIESIPPLQKEEIITINAAKVEEVGIITILFPPHYSIENIERLLESVEEQSGVEAKYKRPKNWEQYQIFTERFIATKSSSIDIIVAPSERWESFESWGMNFVLPEELKRFYHEGFFEYMYNNTITVVPAGIDPLLLFTKDNQSPVETVRDLLGAEVVLGIGFDEKDSDILDTYKEPFTHANSIIEAIITESLSRTMTDWILLLVNNNQWNGKTDKETATLSFLSDTESYTGFKHVQLLPRSSLKSYPVRGFGMIVNKEGTMKSSTAQWISGFITVSVETNTISYPQGIVGPTHSVMQRQFLEEFLAPIQKIRNTKELLYGTIETDDDIIFSQIFKDTASGKIDQKTFLQKVATGER